VIAVIGKSTTEEKSELAVPQSEPDGRPEGDAQVVMGAFVPVDLVPGVDAYAQDSGVEADTGAGIEDSFSEAGSSTGCRGLNGSNQSCGPNVRKEIQNAAFQEDEVASSFGLQLEPAIGVNDAKAKLGDIESEAASGNLYGWVLKVVGALAFESDVVSQADIEPAANADGIVGKGRQIEMAEAAKPPEFDELGGAWKRQEQE
jgi:hypothetical protein